MGAECVVASCIVWFLFLGGTSVLLCDFRERVAGLFARQPDERLRRARETMAGGGVAAE